MCMLFHVRYIPHASAVYTYTVSTTCTYHVLRLFCLLLPEDPSRLPGKTRSGYGYTFPTCFMIIQHTPIKNVMMSMPYMCTLRVKFLRIINCPAVVHNTCT